MNKMLDKLFVSWMLQRVFHVSAGPLQLLMWASWLSAKLRPITDMAFLTRRSYSFFTFGSAFEGGASSDPSIMSQRSMEAESISILNFQRLNLSPWNLSMVLALSPSKEAISQMPSLGSLSTQGWCKKPRITSINLKALKLDLLKSLTMLNSPQQVSVHSNLSSLKETKRALKSLKRGVPHLICTSNSQMHHIIL